MAAFTTDWSMTGGHITAAIDGGLMSSNAGSRRFVNPLSVAKHQQVQYRCH